MKMASKEDLMNRYTSAIVSSVWALLALGFALGGSGCGGGAAATTQNGQPIAQRGDVRNLPSALKARLTELDQRPRTFAPLTVFSEAPTASQLFAYALLDTSGFEPNVFTATIEGINDGAIPTATGANGDLPTIAAVRLVLEPKPDLPTDPNDPGAFIDIFTDISGLFVINNESGWYEGWLIHDIEVPPVADPRADGFAPFGTMLQADADAIAALGTHNNVPGHLFTMDGNAVHFPSATDRFPDVQTNVVPLQLSMGAFNALQQSDLHSYWEFNEYTDWISPAYELPFTGGIPGTFEAGKVGDLQSIVPGSGPAGVTNTAISQGDDPNNPRDPDRGPNVSPTDADRPMENNDDHKETRLRFVPSGLANEVLLDVYVRVASFEPGVQDLTQRLFDAYAAEVARVDQDGDGVISFVEGDLEDTSDGGQPNERLFLPATKFNRFAVTREINDGLLAPRFAPSQRAWALSGPVRLVSPTVDASVPQDADNR
jgi:hypothetical protein